MISFNLTLGVMREILKQLTQKSQKSRFFVVEIDEDWCLEKTSWECLFKQKLLDYFHENTQKLVQQFISTAQNWLTREEFEEKLKLCWLVPPLKSSSLLTSQDLVKLNGVKQLEMSATHSLRNKNEEASYRLDIFQAEEKEYPLDYQSFVDSQEFTQVYCSKLKH